MRIAKQFWTDAAWRAYENAPAGADTLIHLGRRYAMPLLRYAVPLTRVQGRTVADGEPGSLLVAGSGSLLLYLQRRFFASDVRTESLGTCPVHALPRTLLELGVSDDLTVARVAQSLAGLIFDRCFLRVPDLVDVWIDVRDRNQVMQRMNQNMRRKARRIVADELSWAEAHDPDAFERFYDSYYVPFVAARHDDLAVVRERPVLRRHFGHGGIMWVLKDGEEIAGALYRCDGPVLTFLAVGTRDGGLEARRQGALGAVNLFLLEAAHRRGLEWVNLGGCLPSPGAGSFVNKRAWGGELRERPDSHHDLLVRWPRFTPRVARLLADTPLFIRDGEGLAALAAVPTGEPRLALQLWRQWQLPGLERLYVMAADGWRAWQDGDISPSPGRLRLCAAGLVEDVLGPTRGAG